MKTYKRWLAQPGDVVTYGYAEYFKMEVYEVDTVHWLYLGKPVNKEDEIRGYKRISVPIPCAKIVGRLGVMPDDYGETLHSWANFNPEEWEEAGEVKKPVIPNIPFYFENAMEDECDS